MKRALMVFLLLCSVLLLLTERTRAQQEELPIGDEYGQNAEAKIAVEQAVAEDPLIESQTTNSTVDKHTDPEELLIVEASENGLDAENAQTNTTEVVDHYQGISLAILQSEESLSAEILQAKDTAIDATVEDITDVESSSANDSENGVGPESASSEASSQSNDVETEVELENKDGIKVEAGRPVDPSVAETIENAIITTTVSTEESEPAYTTLVDVEKTIGNAPAEPEETEVSTSQSETIATEVSLENNTEHETVKTDTTNADTTTNTPTAPTTASPCTEPGTQALANDCRAYISCTATATNELIKTQKLCPTGQAYNPTLQRCSRDLSPCADAFRCELEGTYAVPHDNSSYYWCVESRLTATYHIYQIKCGNGQIFTHELGKCFVDMTNLQDLPLNYELYMSKSPDEECVREEVKVLRAEEKAKLKEAKLREKIRKKYEKELLKKAVKEAKAQAKLQGISLEDETPYNCVEEGNFAAATESFFDYYICQSKKGTFKAIGMKCADGQLFSMAQNVCVS